MSLSDCVREIFRPVSQQRRGSGTGRGIVPIPSLKKPEPAELSSLSTRPCRDIPVSPITEEAAFRGYCQVILEREFTAPIAVLISSAFFTAAHVVHGFLGPKLLVYFLVGVVFGVMAYVANSTVPAIPVHIIGDLTFFTLVWPYDATRQLVWEGGADRWFWIHVAQAIIFTVLAIPAFVRLARVCKRFTPGSFRHQRTAPRR